MARVPPLPLNADLLNLCALLAQILFLKQGLFLAPRPSLRFCSPSLVQGDLGWTRTRPNGHDLPRPMDMRCQGLVSTVPWGQEDTSGCGLLDMLHQDLVGVCRPWPEDQEANFSICILFEERPGAGAGASKCPVPGDRGADVLDWAAAPSPRSRGCFGFERGCLEAPVVPTLMS